MGQSYDQRYARSIRQGLEPHGKNWVGINPDGAYHAERPGRHANQLALSFAFFGTAEALNAIMSDPQVEGRSQPFRLSRLAHDADCGDPPGRGRLSSVTEPFTLR